MCVLEGGKEVEVNRKCCRKVVFCRKYEEEIYRNGPARNHEVVHLSLSLGNLEPALL